MGWLDDMERADPAYHNYPDLKKAHPCCPDMDIWFDRGICPEPCGGMHERCCGCGRAVDGCVFENATTI